MITNSYENNKTFTILTDRGVGKIRCEMEHAIISFADTEAQRPEFPYSAKTKGSLSVNLSRIKMLSKNNGDMLKQTAAEILLHIESLSFIEWFIIHSTNGYYRGPTTAAALSFIYNGPGAEKRWFDDINYVIDDKFFSAFISVALEKKLL
jgi:hypothetical protein